jgi:hypothetical protein
MIRAFRNKGIASLGLFASVKAIPESFKNDAVSICPSSYKYNENDGREPEKIPFFPFFCHISGLLPVY